MNEPDQACCPECRANNSQEENVRIFKSEKNAIEWLSKFGDIRPTIYPCPLGYGWHIDHPSGWGTLDEIVMERSLSQNSGSEISEILRENIRKRREMREMRERTEKILASLKGWGSHR
jgi:hypothetical protein